VSDSEGSITPTIHVRTNNLEDKKHIHARKNPIPPEKGHTSHSKEIRDLAEVSIVRESWLRVKSCITREFPFMDLTDLV
jgi:hypothetical protein